MLRIITTEMNQMYMRVCATIAAVMLTCACAAQTLGGTSVYNFLRLPATPVLTAAGGVNTSFKAHEVGLTANNPSLLDENVSRQLNASFNTFPGGVHTYSLTGATQVPKQGAVAAGHIYFLDYGAIPQTDAAGNTSGTFRPVDFVVQLSAAKKYLQKWHYGASLKFIHSSYQQYRSSGLAVDAGLLYTDTANDLTASVLARNMGVQLSSYAGERDDLPFDLQVGITKRLAKSPFGFSFTAHHLHQFDILYHDTTFNVTNNFTTGTGFFNKLLNHFVFATHIYLGNHLEGTIGYNHLRRSELNIGSAANGLTGFSTGLRLKLKKFQVLYAHTNYQRNISWNHFGVTMHMDRLFGL
ncbi:MAG TPA: type IX secretion system protein PorQ [Flavisolibacter sp.]